MFSRLLSQKKSITLPGHVDRVVGIDIGSSSLKIVELQNRNDVVTLTTYGEIELGPYARSDAGATTKLDVAVEQTALAELRTAAAVKAKQAVLAIPLTASFATILSLASDKENEDLSARVRVEARKYIPIPISEVTLDWIDIGTRSTDSTVGDLMTHDILVAAIQNDALANARMLVEGNGFKDTPLEIECFSAVRSLYRADTPHAAVIDIGAETAKLYIINQGVIHRIYRSRLGSAQCTAQYAKEYNRSFAEAEAEKRALTDTHLTYPAWQKIYHHHFDYAFREFAKVIAEYQTVSHETISEIIITGGGSLFPNFSQHIADQLSIPTRLAEPFEQVAYPAFMEDTLRAIGPSYTVALGSALRHFV